MNRPLLLAVLLVSSVACSAGEPTPNKEPAGAAEQAPAATGPVAGSCGTDGTVAPEVFGAPLQAEGRAFVALTDILANPESFTGSDVLTTGVVRASCLKKGCWMEIRPEDDRAGASITVRFKDYGFFVPLDSRGASVKLDGHAKVVTLSPTEVARLEEEGASFAEKQPDGSVRQVEFTATGVEMCGRGAAI